MKSYRVLIVLLLILAFLPVYSQVINPVPEYDPEEWGCTSIMVGKKASVDGSVITCHSCDGFFRTWLNIVPSKEYDKGAKKEIYWGFLHTETVNDRRGLILKGEIPEVEKTYAYMNVAYPCLNEKQLGIGETTIMGRRELYNNEGLFLIENLQQIVLERCTTAREAIKLIGELVKEYGYGDMGECLTFADPKEVWHFEIFGGGPFEKGAVWAAVRIPDDHVGVSANIPRISELNLDDPDHYMASDNVFSLAEEMEWWDSKSGEPFKFWKAYSGRKPFLIREYYVLSTMAPSLNLQYESEELPFSVKPDNKVSVRDVLKYYRETYEDTEYDMTQNLKAPEQIDWRRRRQLPRDYKPKIVTSPIANPWMSRDMMTLLNTIKPGTVKRQRTIAIAGCSYSQVIQLRDWLPDEIGGIAWFSFDNPGQSPRIPIFAGTTELPKSFNFCGQHRFRTDAAIWAFRRANKLATVRYGTTREYIENAVQEFEDKAFSELPDLEKRFMELYKSKEMGKEYPKYKELLTQYTNTFAHAAMNKWLELGDTFWGFFRFGF